MTDAPSAPPGAPVVARRRKPSQHGRGVHRSGFAVGSAPADGPPAPRSLTPHARSANLTLDVGGRRDADRLAQHWTLLAGQRTVLERLRSQGGALPAPLAGAFECVVTSLLDAPFGALFDAAAQQAGALRALLRQHPAGARPLATLISTVVALSRVRSSIAFSAAEAPRAAPPAGAGEPGPAGGAASFVCRICEAAVPLAQVGAHSRLCVRAHRGQRLFSRSDRALAAVLAEVAAPLRCAWPGEHGRAVGAILPLLAFHSLVALALGVRAGDPDGAATLAAISSRMDACAVPEEFAALEPAFAAGVAGVRRKAAAATEIEAAERACAGLRQSFSGEPTIAGFEFLGPISSGAFARVYLARRRATGDPFAVKVIRKANIGLKNQMNSVRAERDIMRRLASPFVVTFFYSFVGMNNLYMVMEYVPGGDLFSLLQNCGSLRENDARIYAAQIVAALRFLREHKVVHRDLKPDNCLVTADGHLKLADFGLSFFGATGGNGRVGTPDYMAPEMVLSKPHGFEVDYWALGAMLFEMLAGVTPFHADDPPSTFCNILSGEIDWALLEDVSPPVFDLLRGLLTFDPRERLGAGSVREIMEHNWFAGIDWDNVHALPPVFVPECSPESHRVYFVDRRYEFADSDEADIREDLAAEIPGSPGGDGFAAVALESLADVNMAIAAQIMRRPRAASERLSQPRDP